MQLYCKLCNIHIQIKCRALIHFCMHQKIIYVFQDGDEIHDLEDHFVFPATDYELFRRNIGKDGEIGIGVRNEVDMNSKDFWGEDIYCMNVIL